MAVVDTVVTVLVAVGVVVLPHAVRTSATAISATRAATGVKPQLTDWRRLAPCTARQRRNRAFNR